MQPLRVATLIDSEVVGGSAKVVLQNLENLSQRVRLTPILFTRAPQRKSELQQLLGARNVECRVVEEKFALDPTVLFRLYKIASELSLDLIESNHYKTHLFALLLSKLLGVPWVSVSHGWTAENLKVRLYNALDWLTLPWSNASVAVGPGIRKELERILPRSTRVRYLPTAIDPQIPSETFRPTLREELGINADTLIVGMVGRLSREKGFDLAFDACTQVSKESPQIVLVHIGKGPEEQKLRDRVSSSGVQERFVFLGQREVNHTLDRMRQFDCLLIPSRSEGLPNVLLEAASLSVPVLATRVGGIPDFMGPELAEWTCDVNSSAALAQLIVRFASLDQKGRRALGHEMRQRVLQGYQAKDRVRKVEQLYLSLARWGRRKRR